MLGEGKPDWQANIDWSIGNNTSDPEKPTVLTNMSGDRTCLYNWEGGLA